MLHLRRCFALFFPLLAAACSTSTTITSPSDGGATYDPGDENAPMVTNVSTLGGQSFVTMGGLFKIESDGSLSVVLGNEPMVCQDFTDGRIHAGETLLQAYDLKGTGIGMYTMGEDPVKYARVKTDCTGMPLEDSTDVAGRATSSTVYITAMSDTELSGRLIATFDDGSMASLAFALAPCAVSEPADNATCE